MSAQIAFLKAIAATPDDDGPRLVYADWLEEQGHTARAEFIRVQCQLAAHPLDAGSQARERELLRIHGAAWAAPLLAERKRLGANLQRFCDKHCRGGLEHEPDTAVFQYEFRRGMVHTLKLRNAMLDSRAAKRLAAWPELAALEVLDLGNSGPEEVSDFTFYPEVGPDILGCNWIGNRGVAALAASEFLRNLRELDLGNNRVSDRGAQVLLASGVFPRLRRLSLANVGRRTRAFFRHAVAEACGDWGEDRYGDTPASVAGVVHRFYLNLLVPFRVCRNRLSKAVCDALSERCVDVSLPRPLK